MNRYLIILLFSVVLASVAQVLLKKGASRTYTSFIREYLNIYVLGGYGLMLLSMLLTILSYRGLDFSNVPLIESLGYVLVLFLGCLFFGEKVTFRKIIGVAAILCGIFVYYR